MDMRGQQQRNFRGTLNHESGYRFISQAEEDGRKHGEAFASDEPDPVGDASAPATPTPLMAAAACNKKGNLLGNPRINQPIVAELQNYPDSDSAVTPLTRFRAV